jgi:hypothetical protein
VEEGSDFALRLPLPQVELEKVKLTKHWGRAVHPSWKLQTRATAAIGAGPEREANSATFADGVLSIRFPQPAGTGRAAST